MLSRLLLLFIVVPLAELSILLWIGKATSPQFTLGLVIVTGFIGALLARSQGLRALSRIRHEMSQGRLPTDALVDGILILLAGTLLLTPGVLTDLFGLSLLIPPLRRRWRSGLRKWFGARMQYRTFFTAPREGEAPPQSKIVDSYVVGPSDKTQRKRPET